jgi:hypothetical protein
VDKRVLERRRFDLLINCAIVLAVLALIAFQ